MLNHPQVKFLVNNVNRERLLSLANQVGVNESYFNSGNRVLIHEIQKAQGQELCFQSDLRYSCHKTSCDWGPECKKLTAAWLR